VDARRTARGFTLIELLVVVGVIAVLAGLAAPALGSLTGANARQAASELAGAMRYMFDTAALRHETCRIALDLDARAWWAECAPGAAAVARDARAQERADREDEDLARRFPDEEDAEARRLLARTKFGAFADRLVDKRELPGRAGFGKVHVEGRPGVDEGTTYVHFFAAGQAQRAFVPVVDGDNVYTVVIEPFTGRARVAIGPVEVPE
jgi:general secretion pathway protein H